MKHSPGPFSVGASRACEIEILDAKGCEVARVDIPITADRSTDPCDVQAANVALLTSAPDLLASCRALLDVLQGTGEPPAQSDVDARCRAASAVIRRASGGGQ